MATTKYPINRTIADFCEGLLSKSGMDNMPVDVKANMLMDLYTRFENWMFLSVMQAMDPAQHEQFQSFLADQEDPANPDPQQMEEYLSKNVPDYEEVLKRSMEDFAKTYLGEQSGS